MLGQPEVDLRIECCPKKGKNDKVNVYWNWAERKRGGKRYYGGSFNQISDPERKRLFLVRSKYSDILQQAVA